MRFQAQHTTATPTKRPCDWVWLEEPIEMLRLRSRFTLHTEPAAAAAAVGAPCLQPPGWDATTALELRRHFLSCLALREGHGDPLDAALSEELRRRAADPLAFLTALNAHLHEYLERETRPAGGPLLPAATTLSSVPCANR